PNGYIHVAFGREQEFLAGLAVNKIPGIGAQTYQALKEMGVHTIRDLAAQPIEVLEKRLGKYGHDLWYKARGIHNSPVVPY
ncbi:DNA polymerase thumb domain-containing protein, partial [Escherichia coli]|uniref:DNA polymerase thumb domain-containing protein n=1 Tax=Escherichia coli TaxID=562 RepID=UPI00398B77C6